MEWAGSVGLAHLLFQKPNSFVHRPIITGPELVKPQRVLLLYALFAFNYFFKK